MLKTKTLLRLNQGRIETVPSGEMAPREGLIRNHRHDEPLFVLSMVA